jgi:catechol 2,3-dioxygenase-like lactoylglutathione lyase family enzyme
MPLNALFHTAIKPADLDATRRFYSDIAGMTVDPHRPSTLDFPAAWLKPTDRFFDPAAYHRFRG